MIDDYNQSIDYRQLFIKQRTHDKYRVECLFLHYITKRGYKFEISVGTIIKPKYRYLRQLSCHLDIATKTIYLYLGQENYTMIGGIYVPENEIGLELVIFAIDSKQSLLSNAINLRNKLSLRMRDALFV